MSEQVFQADCALVQYGRFRPGEFEGHFYGARDNQVLIGLTHYSNKVIHPGVLVDLSEPVSRETLQAVFAAGEARGRLEARRRWTGWLVALQHKWLAFWFNDSPFVVKTRPRATPTSRPA